MKKNIILQYVSCINNQSLDDLCNLMTPDHTFILGNHKEEGREKLRESWKSYFAQFPRYRIHVSQVLEKGDSTYAMGLTSNSHCLPEDEAREPVIWQAVIQDNLVASWRIFSDTDENRKKLGIASKSVDILPQVLADEIQSLRRSLGEGAKTAAIRQVRKFYSSRLAYAEPKAVISTCINLIEHYDNRDITYELLYNNKPALNSLEIDEVERLGSGMDSWEDVDTFGCYVSGMAWQKKLITDQQVFAWAKSENRWWRRAALVSTIPLNGKSWGGRGDIDRTLHVCDLLKSDRDDMVVKAVSWALRKLSTQHPQAVLTYTEQNRDTLAARVIREVTNKLTTGLKNPKR